MADSSSPITYVLVDGENLDATLGGSVLGRRPAPEERPRWERVLEFAQRTWGVPVKGLFFINASSGHLPMPFVQALMALGFRPITLAGPPDVKVVDVGIQRTLDALAARPGNVILGSHDGDFVPHLKALLRPDRRVAVLSFGEFTSTAFTPLAADGLEFFDLETDAKAFNHVLPRVRIIDLADFDPEVFL